MSAPNPEEILDFSKPFNVELYDQIVIAFNQGKQELQGVLVKFRKHPQAWTRVHDILEKSRDVRAKMGSLDILSDTIKEKWNVLPKQPKDSIKNYIVAVIIKLASDPKNLKDKIMAMYLRKLNTTLVDILKKDWPHNWPNFIPELVNSSKTSQSLCANNMNILQILSEEIFDFGNEQMTQDKMREMKLSLNKEFTLIYQLCEYILDNSNDAILLSSTLKTLLRFLNWIPTGYIFETKLIQTLAIKFFPTEAFQNDTLACLVEIAGLPLKDQDAKYVPKVIQLFFAVMQHIAKMITPETDVKAIYNSGNNSRQEFIHHLILFLTEYLTQHLAAMENTSDDTRSALITSLQILIRLSRIDDTELFKICLDFWKNLVVDLYNTHRTLAPRQPLILGSLSKPSVPPRVALYSDVCQKLRLVMIETMAKPEEVLIVEDGYGNIVREDQPDTDAIALYKQMREVLVYLTHLDPVDTQETMIRKLSRQVDNSEYNWTNLFRLCWAIGSIAGALTEVQEKNFLVKVIKDLLGLVDSKRGKDHKAVIASNIMYVVGQYPRFLRQHWKFLKTVVLKLFEFMHEKFPGVQEMSVDTFLKIARKCRKKFVVQQQNENRPFIEEMLENLPATIKDLAQEHIYVFYEAVAEIIQAETNPEKKQQLLLKLMELPNASWTQIIATANQNISVLFEPATIKKVELVLKTNNKVASALGSGFMVQLARMYVEMLHLYNAYSKHINEKIQKEGEIQTKSHVVRSMRAVKKESLHLIATFIASSSEGEKGMIMKNFLPALLEPVLEDYKRNIPQAREAEVLLLFSQIVRKLGNESIPFIPKVFECTFEATLSMITKNFDEFPDHRICFFQLLAAIASCAFPAFLKLSQNQFKLIVDSIIWAIKHIEKNVAETGLTMLLDLLTNIEKSEIANDFYKSFFLLLVNELLAVLTDSFHKPGFSSQATILAKLFNIVETNSITVPLWVPNQPPHAFPNNQTFVRGYVINVLRKAFPNVAPSQIESFVTGLFQLNTRLPQFKIHLRDFLIQTKEFSKDNPNNQDLFLEEQKKQTQENTEKERARLESVPGLMPQASLNEAALGSDKESEIDVDL